MSQTIDNKTRQLIAVGASMAANCIPCLHHHYQAALSAGATTEEIIEAIKIGEITKTQPGAHIKQEVLMLLNERGNSLHVHADDKKACG